MTAPSVFVPTPRAAEVVSRERAIYAASAHRAPQSWQALAELRGKPVAVRAWGEWFDGQLVDVETEPVAPGSNGKHGGVRRLAVVWVGEVGSHLFVSDLRRLRVGEP